MSEQFTATERAAMQRLADEFMEVGNAAYLCLHGAERSLTLLRKVSKLADQLELVPGTVLDEVCRMVEEKEKAQ